MLSKTAPAQAATSTVCASGCDYTTLGGPAGAFMNVIMPGDVIAVGATYSSTTEPTFPLQILTPEITLDCQNNPTMIGSTSTDFADPNSNILYLSSTSTIRNCTFGNITIGTPSYISGFSLRDNTFSPSFATSTIKLNNGAALFTIENNTNIGGFSFGPTSASSSRGTIQSNTFYSKQRPTMTNVLQLLPNSLNMSVIENTFSFYQPVDDADSSIILSGDGTIFASNTLRFIGEQASTQMTGIKAKFANGGSIYIGGNFIDTPATSTCVGLMVYPNEDTSPNGTVSLINNTIRLNPSCTRSSYNGGSKGLDISDIMRNGTSLVANVYYNIIRNGGNVLGTGNMTGLSSGAFGVGSAITLNEDYNGISGFYATSDDGVGGVITLGGGSRTDDPVFRTGNASSLDDLEIVPFSNYLDVTGARDIGATDAARRSSVNIDDSGTIDYSTVDATTTSQINDFIRSGDTLTFAAGSYTGFYVSSTHATTSIAIVGAGNDTVITAPSGQDAIKFYNVSTSTLSGVRLTGAAAGTATYTISKMLFSYGGNDYSDAVVPFGIPSGTMLVWTGSGCALEPAASDGYDITALTSGGTESFSVALIDLGGSRLTALVPKTSVPNGAAFDADCGGIGAVTDAYIDNLFTASGGVYSYDNSSVVSALATLMATVTDPPTITRVQAGYAGLRLTDAVGWTVSNVTSTGNLYGIAFSGSTANATIQDSVIQNSTSYDVVAAGNYTNILDNTRFTRASTTLSTPMATLQVKFRLRAYVTDSDGGLGVAGIYASSTDDGSTVTSLGATTAGYTSYARLPAYVINMMGSEVTNGGYNPYTVSVGSLSGYSASTSAAFNLTTPDQTVSIAAIRTAPAAPSDISVPSVGTSAATVTWTDNATNEAEFLFDYINIDRGESFPSGSATTLSANDVSEALASLSPNVPYQVRVAARNAGGTSSYATSSVFYTLAATSSAPTLAALSRTSVSVAIAADDNSTSTEYAIYSSTLGGYLSSLGAVTTTQVWQVTSTWDTVTVDSLTCNTAYSFVTIARNVDEISAATSTAATVTTSACASSGGSGGGGGGGGGAVGGGGGAGGTIQTFFNQPTTPIPATAPVVTLPPAIFPPVVTPPISPVLPSAPTLQEFLLVGTTPRSRALGTGERQAVLRDAVETMGRDAAAIPASDLERISNGQIPLTRNLAYERSMVPRALATFRSIFGHTPNFRNETENLAWNTLMYRIRFPRNLVEERQGIVDFRRAFGIAPVTPFQWAAVRVMGYLR